MTTDSKAKPGVHEALQPVVIMPFVPFLMTLESHFFLCVLRIIKNATNTEQTTTTTTTTTTIMPIQTKPGKSHWRPWAKGATRPSFFSSVLNHEAKQARTFFSLLLAENSSFSSRRHSFLAFFQHLLSKHPTPSKSSQWDKTAAPKLELVDIWCTMDACMRTITVLHAGKH
jgi:hypothetical protein